MQQQNSKEPQRPSVGRWPFSAPQDLAVFTTRRFLAGTTFINQVFHEPTGEWQFTDGEPANAEEIAVVRLDEMTEMDPSLRELAALPMGFFAERETLESPWQVWYNGESDDEEDAEEPDPD